MSTTTGHAAYAQGWDTASRTLIGPLPRTEAEARDRAGEPYVVALARAVGEPVAAVVHVAAAHHYVGIWVYDGSGRRVREADLRMLDPDELFLRHRAEWRYPDSRTPEFADNAWRETIDLFPGSAGRRTLQPTGRYGSATTTAVEIPADDRRLPRYAFGSWGPLVASALPDADLPAAYADAGAPATGKGPGEGAPLTPPAPGRPKLLDLLATPGLRVADPDEGRTMTVLPPTTVGQVSLPSGRLVVRDPYFPSDGDPLTVAVTPGEYRAESVGLRTDPEEFHGQEISYEVFGAVRLVIGEKPTVRWESGLLPGQDPRLLRNNEVYGFGVDSGTGCFADHAAWPATQPEYQRMSNAREFPPGSVTGYRCVMDPETGGGLMEIGLDGDGTYPVWIGRDADGEVTAFAVENGFLDDLAVLDEPHG